MADHVYRFRFIGGLLKTAIMDLAINPTAVAFEGFQIIDITADDSQLNELRAVMTNFGYEFIGTDSAISAREYADFILGLHSILNVNDNTNTDILICPNITAAGAVRSNIIKYSYYMPTARRRRSGKITVLHNGVNAAEITDHEYSFLTGYEIPQLTFSVVLVANALYLRATLTAVGEQPTEFVFKVSPNYGSLTV